VSHRAEKTARKTVRDTIGDGVGLGYEIPGPWRASKVGDRWPSGEVVERPVKAKDLTTPRVLVRRRESPLVSPYDHELVICEGYPSISLFTGAGGMDIGLEQAGFMTRVQHEWSQSACQTLIGNRPIFFPHAALIQGDIRNTPTSMLLREGNLRVGETYLLSGGPPCQGFTIANSKAGRGEYDTRNDLVFEYLRVIREAQPKFFIFENVANFQSFKGKNPATGERYHEQFLRMAYESYYELVYGLIDCVEYGVPQYRVRWICAGTRRDMFEVDGMLSALPKPTNFGKKDLPSILTLDGGLFQSEVNKLTRQPGVRYFPDRPVLVTPCPTSRVNDGRSKSFHEFYDRLERDEPDRLVREPLNGMEAAA
jgi:site-specific DNA-cytosine methylase